MSNGLEFAGLMFITGMPTAPGLLSSTADGNSRDHGEVGPFKVEQPMVLGHESAGVITQVGDKVTSLKVGDRVAMEPGVPCRRCERCREGRYNLCYDMAFAATPPVDGTLAKYYTLPGDFCYKL